MSDWPTFRSLFPALRSRVYLNTAGGGVMASQTAAAAQRYYDESVANGDIGWDAWLERSDQDRVDVARIVGAEPDRISFLPNASLGFNILALGLPSPLRICALDTEFPSCTTPFLRQGASMHFISTQRQGQFELDDLDDALSSGADAFVVSSVQFANGFRADLEAISQVCRRHETLLLVDATQSIGAFPIDMQTMGIDALVFSGYKWATAGYGNAVMVTGDRWPSGLPPLVGWRSARDAYALENNRLDMLTDGIAHELGHPPFPGLFTLSEALRLLDETGIEAISQRILELVTTLQSGLHDMGVETRSSRKRQDSSGIVLVEAEDPARVCAALKQRNVWTSAREGGIRVSLHAYNDESDIQGFLEALQAVS